MIVDCPKCKKKYNVNEALIPVGGAHVQCPACSNIFSIYRVPLDIPLEPVEETQAAQPTKEKEFQVDTEPLKPTREEEPVGAETTSTIQEKPAGIDAGIPPVEERTKLWEKLQQSYASEKRPSSEHPADTEQKATIEPTISSDEEVTFEPPPTSTAPPEETTAEEESAPQTPSVEIPTAPPSDTAQQQTAPTDTPPPTQTSSPTAVEAPVSEEDKTIKEAKRLARSLVKDILLYHGDKVEIGLRQGNLAQLIGDEIRKSWKFYKDSFPLEKTNNVNYFKEALNEIIGKGKPIFK